MSRDDDEPEDEEYGHSTKRPVWGRRDIGIRLEDFVEARLAGFRSYTQVIDDAQKWTKETFGHECSVRTAARAIAEVRRKWTSAERETVEVRRAGFRAATHELIKQAVDAGDFRAVAVMMRTLAEVEGIKAPKRVEHGGTVGLRPVAAMAPAEREEEIKALLAKRAAAGNVISAPVQPLQLEAGDPDEAFVRELEAMAAYSSRKDDDNVH